MNVCVGSHLPGDQEIFTSAEQHGWGMMIHAIHHVNYSAPEVLSEALSYLHSQLNNLLVLPV